MIILSLEGAIAVGKSTLLEKLETSSLANRYHLVILREPVKRWQNVKGANLLEKYYQNPRKFAFVFQNHVLETRAEMMVGLPEDGEKEVLVIMERSWHSDFHCFAKMHYNAGNFMHLEYTLLQEHYEQICRHCPPVDGVVMLRLPVEAMMSRLALRGRFEEGGVTPEFQSELADVHDGWLQSSGIPHISLSTQTPYHVDPEALESVVRKVESFVQVVKMQRESGNTFSDSESDGSLDVSVEVLDPESDEEDDDGFVLA